MESAACSIAGLESLRVGTPDQACAQVVLLHGYDMRPEDLEPFSHSLNCSGAVPFSSRAAAESLGQPLLVAHRPGKARQTTASRGRAISARSHRRAGRPRASALCGFLDELRAQSPKLPLLLGGFSQGGMLACDTVLCARQPVSGLVMLSSSRIAFDDWQANREALTGLPVLVSHGTHDADLAFSAGEALRDFYRNSGARVTWQPFEGGHEIPLVVWRALQAVPRGTEPQNRLIAGISHLAASPVRLAFRDRLRLALPVRSQMCDPEHAASSTGSTQKCIRIRGLRKGIEKQI